jgi:hypothetical protein
MFHEVAHIQWHALYYQSVRLPRIPNHRPHVAPPLMVIPSLPASASRHSGGVEYSYLMTGSHLRCKNRYGTYSRQERQEYVSGGHLAASFTSRSLEQISHLPKHFILNAGKGTTLKRTYQSKIQSRPVDRRICFVKFCHAPPVVDQQGCFIHIKRAGSSRLRHRRSFLRNICSRDLIC